MPMLHKRLALVLAALSLTTLSACQTPSGSLPSDAPERLETLATDLEEQYCRGQKPLPVTVPPVEYSQWPDAAKQYRFANICQWALQCDAAKFREMRCPVR